MVPPFHIYAILFFAVFRLVHKPILTRAKLGRHGALRFCKRRAIRLEEFFTLSSSSVAHVFSGTRTHSVTTSPDSFHFTIIVP